MRASSGGSAGFDLGGRERIAVQDRVEDDRRRLARERQRARRHLVEHRPEREQVRARVRELAARLLRRHVRHRAHRRAGRREVADRLEAGDGAVAPAPPAFDPGEAEVEDLHLPARVHEDVRRLDVAVDDAAGVRRLERVRDLDRRSRARPRGRTAGARPSSARASAPSRHSITMKCCPSCSSMAYTVQMPGWFSAEEARASRWKRSSDAPSRASSGGRNFRATWRPSFASSASYTTPIPPLPSRRTTE